MPSPSSNGGNKRSPYPDMLGSYDWGQAGMRPSNRAANPEFWACMGSLVLIVAAVLASAVL